MWANSFAHRCSDEIDGDSDPHFATPGDSSRRAGMLQASGEVMDSLDFASLSTMWQGLQNVATIRLRFRQVRSQDGRHWGGSGLEMTSGV